jgi:uncharacterized BrkB/YihY/UPF0761 family membrane protein
MQNPAEIDSDAADRPTRNIFLRILFCGLWFVGLFFITYMAIGLISAAFTDTSKYQSHAEASSAASQSGGAFADRYGLLVFFTYIVVFIVLCFFRLLPGVSKYRKLKSQDA